MARPYLSFLTLLKSICRPRAFRRSSSAASTARCSLHNVADVAAVASRRLASEAPASSSHVDDLHTAVDDLVVDDLSVSPDQFQRQFSSMRSKDRQQLHARFDTGSVVYIPVCESDLFTIVVFIMPPGSVIPLHDHVGMHVVSRVLWGVLDVLSFDVVHRNPTGTVLATRRRPVILEANHISALGPHSGNLHTFQAREWTAVFDVLVPPYNEDFGRTCTYYRVPDSAPEQPGATVQLEPVECPKNFATISWPYYGTPIDR